MLYITNGVAIGGAGAVDGRIESTQATSLASCSADVQNLQNE